MVSLRTLSPTHALRPRCADNAATPLERARPTPATASSIRIRHKSALPFVSDTFDPTRWREVEGFDFADITYHRGVSRGPEADGRPEGADMPVVRIAFDRPDIRNAFRPGTVDELYRALDHARQTSSVAAVILTGNGPSARDGGYSFCSGGDQPPSLGEGPLPVSSTVPTLEVMRAWSRAR